MTSKRPIIVAGGVVVAAVAWYLFRPELLFIDKSVSEAFPAASANAAPASSSSNTGIANSGPTTLRAGTFHGVAHETRGVATIHQIEGGTRVLRFTDFETSNGPDLRVLLIAADDATDSDAVKNAMPLELAPLKGNKGDQNYELPADVDLSQYRACTIWCNRFGVNFATAPLRDDMNGQALANKPAPAGPTLLHQGRFHGVAHETRGTATVHDLGNGKRVLRFTDFETSNGPDLRVLLIAADDATDSDAVKNAMPLELAPLRGNKGDQNYELPADVDLSQYRACTIWCNRFGVNFATAPLTAVK